MVFRISRSQRLMAVIGISCSFFLAEISGMRCPAFFFFFGYPTQGKLSLFSTNDVFGTVFDLVFWKWLLNCHCHRLTLPLLVGFYTHSLALVADAFHYVRLFQLEISGIFAWADNNCQLNDLVGFVVALAAVRVSIHNHHSPSSKTDLISDRYHHQVSERDDPPKSLTFGWQRSQLLGAFFNGVLLLGLGISIFLQSIERFVSLRRELSANHCDPGCWLNYRGWEPEDGVYFGMCGVHIEHSKCFVSPWWVWTVSLQGTPVWCFLSFL